MAFAIAVMGLATLAVALLQSRTESTSDAGFLDLVVIWVVPIAVIVSMVRFTSTYPDRVGAQIGAGPA